MSSKVGGLSPSTRRGETELSVGRTAAFTESPPDCSARFSGLREDKALRRENFRLGRSGERTASEYGGGSSFDALGPLTDCNSELDVYVRCRLAAYLVLVGHILLPLGLPTDCHRSCRERCTSRYLRHTRLSRGFLVDAPRLYRSVTTDSYLQGDVARLVDNIVLRVCKFWSMFQSLQVCFIRQRCRNVEDARFTIRVARDLIGTPFLCIYKGTLSIRTLLHCQLASCI